MSVLYYAFDVTTAYLKYAWHYMKNREFTNVIVFASAHLGHLNLRNKVDILEIVFSSLADEMRTATVSEQPVLQLYKNNTHIGTITHNNVFGNIHHTDFSYRLQEDNAIF